MGSDADLSNIMKPGYPNYYENMKSKTEVNNNTRCVYYLARGLKKTKIKLRDKQ